MNTLEELLEFLKKELEMAKLHKANGSNTQSRIYADGKETAYLIVIGEVRAMIAKSLTQAVVSGSLPADIAEKILKARDAHLQGDFDEVHHQLYSIASPGFDKMYDEVWVELERAAGRH